MRKIPPREGFFVAFFYRPAKDGDLRVVDIIQPDTYNSIRQDMENFESFSAKLATLSQKTFNNDVKAEYQALLAQIISDVEAYKR